MSTSRNRLDELTDELRTRRISRKEFVTRATALGLSLPAVSAMVAACAGDGEGAAPTAPTEGGRPQRGGELIVGIPIEPLTLDPVVMTWADESSLDVWDHLIIRDFDGNYVAQAAESWEVSDDSLIYAFKLKPDRQFHDGEPFNAAAVKAFFDTIRNPDSGSLISGIYMSRIDSIETPDDLTVVFNLKETDASFLFGVANTYAGIVSIAAREKAGPDFGTKVAIGSGPFKLKEWAAGDRVVVTRNESYHDGGPVFKNQGAPYLDGVIYRYLPEAASRAIELESGNVHVVRDVPFPDVERLKDNPDIEIVSTPSWDIPMFMFNMEKAPFDDVRVRRAIAQAIDKQSLVDTVTLGNGRVINSPIVPHAREYWAGSEELNPFDPDAARALFAEAGWILGPSGILEKEGQRFNTSLSIWDTTIQRQQAQVIQQNLASVGISMEIVSRDKAGLNAALTEGDFDMGTIDLSWDDPLPVVALFFTSAGSPFPNYARYMNATVDDLFSKVRSTTNPDELKELAEEIQRTILEDAPAVFLYTADEIYGMRKSVHELTPYIWSFHPFKIDTWIAD